MNVAIVKKLVLGTSESGRLPEETLGFTLKPRSKMMNVFACDRCDWRMV
jgi:hypothetical protein